MTLGNDNGTDGQTDRQSATQYAAPPREEGRIIIDKNSILNKQCAYMYIGAGRDVHNKHGYKSGFLKT